MIYYYEVRKIMLDYLKEKGLDEGMKNILQMLAIIIQEGEYKLKEEGKKDEPIV